MIYLLDTNAVSDLMIGSQSVTERIEQHLIDRDVLALCQPVYYELVRGLVWRNATTKITILRNKIIPKFDWIPLEDADWFQAALFWSDAVSAGRQLSDIDFLLAALAHRLEAIVVSADNDFDALPLIKREDWREPPA